MKVLLVALSALVVAVSASSRCDKKCAACPVLERSDCLAGVDKDPECGCCDVCSRFEGQSCDPKDTKPRHGQCGDGLDCKRTRIGNICQCKYEDLICGTDGKTYNNLCQMTASAVRQNKKQNELAVKSVGPCEPGAQIVTKPEYVKNSTNNNIVLTCEAIGFPAPTIAWVVSRANGKIFTLPGDDNHIVISTRGGPGRYQVTGWMQVEGLMKRHEGDYTCIATNEHKDDKATARIKVMN
jgi:hypothetical protein